MIIISVNIGILLIWRRKHVLSLQWRRNQRDGVSNHEPNHYIDVIMTTIASQITSLTFVYSTVYWDADQRKHQSSASLAFVWGTHRDRWIPRTKGQLRGKCFHLMTSSWWLFTQLIIHAQLKENIKAPHDWYLWGEFTGDQRIPHTRASNLECFHLMSSSYGIRTDFTANQYPNNPNIIKLHVSVFWMMIWSTKMLLLITVTS